MRTEYYTRLEQGRTRNPSSEVVDALARALQLDESERERLTNPLARPASARRAPSGPQRVRPGLHLMPQTLDPVPAFILGRRTDVLASNRVTREALTDFDALPAPGQKLARYYLLAPKARARVGDWEQIAVETVAVLRLEAGRNPHDRQLADLVEELALSHRSSPRARPDPVRLQRRTRSHSTAPPTPLSSHHPADTSTGSGNVGHETPARSSSDRRDRTRGRREHHRCMASRHLTLPVLTPITS